MTLLGIFDQLSETADQRQFPIPGVNGSGEFAGGEEFVLDDMDRIGEMGRANVVVAVTLLRVMLQTHEDYILLVCGHGRDAGRRDVPAPAQGMTHRGVARAEQLDEVALREPGLSGSRHVAHIHDERVQPLGNLFETCRAQSRIANREYQGGFPLNPNS